MAENLVLSNNVCGIWRWNEINEDQRLKIFDKCMELGITSFDAADIYGGYTCEGLFGDVLEIKRKSDPNIRSKIQIVTKASICLVVPGKNNYNIAHYDTSREHLLASVENSLRNMKTDYIDLFLLHRPDFFT